MPEQNFEQQARDMMNGFEMKPGPEVWQNVCNAIQEPRRKRRFMLWWWLLPLSMIGSGIALYRFNKIMPATGRAAEANNVHQKNTDQIIIHPEQSNEQQTGSERDKRKEDIDAKVSLSKSSNSNPSSSSKIKTVNVIADKRGKTIHKAFDEKNAAIN